MRRGGFGYPVGAGSAPTRWVGQGLPRKGWWPRHAWSMLEPRRCMMLEPVVGLVPLDDLIAGLRADVLADHEPAGETLERRLQARVRAAKTRPKRPTA